MNSGVTIWLTGFSGAGKSTIAAALASELTLMQCKTEILDGDRIRNHLSPGLGFSKEDRDEHVRRMAFVAHLLTKHGVVAIVSAISPYRAIRNEIRNFIASFVEVFVNAPLSVCEQRDVKGLYRLARMNRIKNFTGIDAPYEPPLQPEVECFTEHETVEQCVGKVLGKLAELGFIYTVNQY